MVAELLERQAADPATATTSEHLDIPAGSTALSVAELKGHDDVVSTLRSASAATCKLREKSTV